MNNGNSPATAHMEFNPENLPVEYHQGLTKREHFAAMAMQGIMASQYYGDHATDNVSGGTGRESGAAIKAVMMADALLDALEQ
tara:strand:- start:1686 stop:1934 length:249 start_codon:yes stop_codon:yes gene_type:complete